MINRALNDPRASGASNFTDETIMNNALNKILWENSTSSKDISNWFYNSTRSRFIDTYEMNDIIGKGVFRNDPTNFIDLTKVRIVIDREGDSFIPITIYPTK
ncbi:RNase A-like domain-containing protein [Sebaldella termitidis]|uniref:RNase A-like domain-containing protein n=1 Tax=Sebaldella termitidis TaxID=826 RepID=UPI003EB84A66